MPFSSTKPRISPPCASDLAQTTKTSAIGELLIQVFEPVSRNPSVDLDRARLHAAGVGARVGLGQAEAADQLAAGELRQILAPLLLRAVGVDRIHHQLDCTDIIER